MQFGLQKVVVGDALLVAVGRVPHVEGIGLEAAGVQYDVDKGVQVGLWPCNQLPCRECKGYIVDCWVCKPIGMQALSVPLQCNEASSCFPVVVSVATCNVRVKARGIHCDSCKLVAEPIAL